MHRHPSHHERASYEIHKKLYLRATCTSFSSTDPSCKPTTKKVTPIHIYDQGNRASEALDGFAQEVIAACFARSRAVISSDRLSVARKRAEGIVRTHLWILACDKAHFESLAEASRNRHLAKTEDTVDKLTS